MSLSEALPGDRCANFFTPACECLLRFCRAFPPLSTDASSLLLLIGQLTASRAVGDCGDELGRNGFHIMFCLIRGRYSDSISTPDKLKSMPDRGGNRTYDLACPMVCQVRSLRVGDISKLNLVPSILT